MQNEQGKPSGAAARSEPISGRINDFVQRHRKIFFCSTVLIVAAVIAFIAALSIADTLNKKAISAVEEFSARYETLRPSITEDYSAIDAEELVAEITVFARKNSGYAGGRAWSIIGALYSDQGNWEAAETAWLSAARAAKKTYLVPVAFFNAGVAAEEQGKTDVAIAHYTDCLAMAGDFPGAARAQFSIGRLFESQDETAAAIEAYRAVIAGWSYDWAWMSLAQNRIIALEIE